MRNPQRFEGLEEDKITWHSNSRAWLVTYAGLEEDEIAWYSNIRQLANQTGLEGCEITWHSNIVACILG